LSTEELVDCVKGDRCRGGDITDDIDYLQKRGAATAEDYPDTSSNARPAKKVRLDEEQSDSKATAKRQQSDSKATKHYTAVLYN